MKTLHIPKDEYDAAFAVVLWWQQMPEQVPEFPQLADWHSEWEYDTIASMLEANGMEFPEETEFYLKIEEHEILGDKVVLFSIMEFVPASGPGDEPEEILWAKIEEAE